MNTEINLHELYDVVYEPFWYQTWFKITATFVGCAIALVIWWLLYRWYTKKTVISTPSEKMMNVLNQLQTQLNAGTIKPRQFYHQLTVAFKQYLTTCLSVNLVDKTDYELIEELKKTPFAQEELHDLKKLLDNAVLAKFAQHEIPEQVLASDLEWCKKQISLLRDISKSKKDIV